MVSALLGALLLVTASATPAEHPVTIPSGPVTLSATLTVPPGPGPHPAAVLVGGFGPSTRDGGPGAVRPYAALARRLAARGIVVLRYDKRGLGDSDGPPLSWLDARPLTADARAATRLLASLPGVDRSRVALIGHSQGGDIALSAAPRSPATRIVTLAAPGRPLGSLPGVSAVAAGVLDRIAGPGAARATLGADPRRAAARAARPALLVHGTRDGVVPISDLGRLAAARRTAGLPTRTLRVPGGDHFVQVGGRVPEAAVRRIAAFAG